MMPEGIEIRQGGFMPTLANKLKGRVLYFNLLITVALLFAFLLALVIQNYLLASFFAAMAGFYIFLSWQQRNISLTRFIPRDQIESVFFHEAIPGQTRASFVIWFRNPKGKRLQRKLLLPVRSEQDNMVVQSAIQIMREENLLTT
jgi:hypothetical protein